MSKEVLPNFVEPLTVTRVSETDFFEMSMDSGLVTFMGGLCVHQNIIPGESVQLGDTALLAGGSLPFVPALVFREGSINLHFQTPSGLHALQSGVVRFPDEFLDNLYNYMLVEKTSIGIRIVNYSGPTNPFGQNVLTTE